jgi:hypothetical protein
VILHDHQQTPWDPSRSGSLAQRWPNEAGLCHDGRRMCLEVAALVVGLVGVALAAVSTFHQVRVQPRRADAARTRDVGQRVLDSLERLNRQIVAAEGSRNPEEDAYSALANAWDQDIKQLDAELPEDIRRRARSLSALLRHADRLELAGDARWIRARVVAVSDVRFGARGLVTGEPVPCRFFPDVDDLDDLLARGQQLRTNLEPLEKELIRRMTVASTAPTARRRWLSVLWLSGVMVGVSVAILLSDWLR